MNTDLLMITTIVLMISLAVVRTWNDNHPR